MTYNWEQKDWLRFQYNESEFTELALQFVALAGESQGYVQSLSGNEQSETILTLLVKEAIKSFAIEGEILSREDLVSSIRNNLGYPTASYRIKDKRAEGIAMLLVKARENIDDDLTEIQLFEWHKLLMMGNNYINSGQYRSHSEPMQVVSGASGKETVHFEAPPSVRVPEEMRLVIVWCNKTKPNRKSPIANLIVRASIAHLYF